jgi:hypothetical protein
VPRKGIATLIALVVGLSLALAACGGSSSKNAEPTTYKIDLPPLGATDRVSVQKCLVKFGFEVVTSGDLPVVEGSKALGVRIKGQRGKITPGDLSVAIFWYDSAAKAARIAISNPGRFPTVVSADNRSEIVVAYDPNGPSEHLQNLITACALDLKPPPPGGWPNS